MKKTNTKALALCIGAAAFALAAAGCSFQTGSTPTTAMSDSSAAQTSAGQNGSSASAENGASSDPSADPFYDLLMQGDPDAVMDYINQHIAGASEIDKEDYILGLCRMTDDLTEIDFSRLAPSAEWLPEDMNHFIAIMEQEYQNPVSADGIIMAPIPELLERALQFEEQKNLYPDGITAPIAAELYEERMNAAIAGGYSKNMQTPSQYLNDEGTRIAPLLLDSYTNFVDAYPDSHTAEVVKEYLELLEHSGGAIDDAVEEFYENLWQKL